MDCCDHCQAPDPHRGNTAYRHVLWAVLVINAAMFLIEIGAGLAAGSASLQADALDFFGDAANYVGGVGGRGAAAGAPQPDPPLCFSRALVGLFLGPGLGAFGVFQGWGVVVLGLGVNVVCVVFWGVLGGRRKCGGGVLLVKGGWFCVLPGGGCWGGGGVGGLFCFPCPRHLAVLGWEGCGVKTAWGKKGMAARRNRLRLFENRAVVIRRQFDDPNELEARRLHGSNRCFGGDPEFGHRASRLA